MKNQRYLDDRQEQSRENDTQNGVCIVGGRDLGIVAGEYRIGLQEARGEDDDRAEQSREIEEQCEAVEPEYIGSTLLSSSQQKKYDQENDSCSKLGAVVDAHPDRILSKVVDHANGHVERGSIRKVESDILRPGIETRRHDS